jgi:membrane protein implicated in regulation of membrane protease activity
MERMVASHFVGAVYLAALVLGLGVLLLQFVMPGSEAGGAHAPEFGGHGDFDAHHALDHHAHADAHHGPGGAIAIFLSFRFWTFGLMSFGFVGTLLHYLGLASSVVTLGTAAAVGVLSGLSAALAMRAVSRSQTSSGGEADDAVGLIGRVLVAIERGKHGKVRVEVRGRLVDFIATSDDERLEGGESVIVVEVRGTTAHVSRAGDSIAPKAFP